MKQRNVFRMSIFGKLFLVVALFVGGGNSVWAQKSLPYSYGFENNDLGAEGWTIIDQISSTAIVKTGPYVQVRTGDYGFRFNSGYNKTEYLVSPLFESSSTGIELSFYYKNATTSSKEMFYVGYSTLEGEGEPQASSFTWLTDALLPAASMSDFLKYNVTINNTSIKYVAIKHVSANSHNVFIDDVTIEAAETYKRPKALTVSSYTSSTVTLSWTNGDNETAWEIAYSTKEDFNPDSEGIKVAITENPYTLTDLIENVTYYAYVRSNYNGIYSAWSSKVEFKPVMQTTVNENGTTPNASVPIIDRTYSSSFMQSQFIIPASDENLKKVRNCKITKLTFYSSQPSIDWNGATFEVYMNEVDKTIFSGSTSSVDLFTDWGTKVFNSGTLSVSNGQMIIQLSTPFLYTDGNLMIGFKQTAISGEENNTKSISSNWYGVTQADYTALYYGQGYSSVSAIRAKFMPKVTLNANSLSVPVTLGANGFTTFACPRPLDLANLPSGLKAYKAAVNGDKVNFTEINQTVPANTGMLLEGTAGETYFIPVAESGTAPDGNEFLVNSTGGTFAAETGFTYFGLLKNSDPLTFGVFNPASVAIPTNKAYLKVAGVKGARVLSCSFSDGDIQGIEDNVTEHDNQLSGSTIFNLAGQKVENPTKGLYIINGRKQVIK